MKQILAGVVLIILLGFAGLLYRNTMERPFALNSQACTEEAKMCPDGTSVARTGPLCAFAPCLFPNVEVPDAKIAFAVPAGYSADENAYGADPSLIAAFIKPALGDGPPHTIIVRQYPIREGESADDVILAHTRYQPADMQATDKSRFTNVSIGAYTLEHTVIERFEAQIESAYYLVREQDVLRFSITERDVTNWMEPDLVIDSLPEHQALRSLIESLQTTP